MVYLTSSGVAASTANLFVSTSNNVGIGTTVPTANLHVTGNIYASNSVTTTNLVTAGITSNATTTTFNYDTLTIPFMSVTTLNVASTSNTLTQSIQGSAGQTSLTVIGNVYVSNAMTTTNVFATTVSASTQFSGPGTGLTGSAASLSVGGSAGSLSATLGLTSGGTGQTSAQTAMNALAGAVTSTQYLRGNGTNVVMSAIQAGDVPTLNQNTSGSAGSLSTTYTAGRILYGAGSGVPTTVSTLFYDSGNGRLGIGTASPTAPLHVGDGTAYQNGTTTITKLALMDSTVATIGTVNIQMGKASSTYDSFFLSYVNLGASSASNYAAFNWYNGATTMAIQASGNVGIGTVSPSYPLHVVGQVATGSAASYYFNINGGFSAITTAWNTGIYSQYYVTSTSGFAAWSDSRIKKNVRAIENSLSAINKLRPINYNYIDAAYGQQVKAGLIAQEVREVLPDSVSKTTAFVPNIYKAATALTSNTVTLDGHGLVPGDKVRLVSEINANIETKIISVDGPVFTVEADLTKETRLFVFGKEVEDFLILDYDHVFNVAVGAIQELSSENTALKQSLASATARLDSLEARLAAAGI
jgi:hypothetical protein